MSCSVDALWPLIDEAELGEQPEQATVLQLLAQLRLQVIGVAGEQPALEGRYPRGQLAVTRKSGHAQTKRAPPYWSALSASSTRRGPSMASTSSMVLVGAGLDSRYMHTLFKSAEYCRPT